MSNKNKSVAVEQDWDIQVTGRHVEVTAAMKDYAIEKLSKIERYSLRVSDAKVTMDIGSEGHCVDVTMQVNNFRLKARCVTDDMYASIDGVVDKVQRQLRRYKRRLQDHHAKGLAEVSMMVDVIRPHADEYLEELNDQIDEANLEEREQSSEAPHVENTESRPLKTLTTDEAMMKMELSGDMFLVYRNEADRGLCVIYRRQDGNYGIIRPEA